MTVKESNKIHSLDVLVSKFVQPQQLIGQDASSQFEQMSITVLGTCCHPVVSAHCAHNMLDEREFAVNKRQGMQSKTKSFTIETNLLLRVAPPFGKSLLATFLPFHLMF